MRRSSKIKVFEMADGTLLDINHLQAVGPIVENWKYAQPFVFQLTLAFNTKKIVAFDDEHQAKQAREGVIRAWLTP